MKTQLNFAIIGIGRFGKNYLKTLSGIKEASVRWVCSSNHNTLNEALPDFNSNYQIKKTTNFKKILDDKDVDAVIISTPGSTHYRIAKGCLNAGKHVLVEKPFCLKSKEAKDLLKVSKNKKKICAVGHLHMFNPGIEKLRKDIKSGIFGKINYISITHLGNGPVRSDISALWDFLPHSVSIFLHLLETNPIQISINGASFLRKGVEDIVAMEMKFPNNIFAASFCSWLHPQKKMEVVVAGEKIYSVFDDYAQDKLKYFDSVPKLVNGKIIIDDKGSRTVSISDAKPLTSQINHFIDCIKNSKTPINDAENGFVVTSILEIGQKSMKQSKQLKI